MPYMLAEGPPMSEIYPLKPSMRVTFSISANTERSLREEMNLP